MQYNQPQSLRKNPWMKWPSGQTAHELVLQEKLIKHTNKNALYWIKPIISYFQNYSSNDLSAKIDPRIIALLKFYFQWLSARRPPLLPWNPRTCPLMWTELVVGSSPPAPGVLHQYTDFLVSGAGNSKQQLFSKVIPGESLFVDVCC